MSRIKVIFAVLMLAAIVGIVPQAQATTVVQVAIAGSSAMWQTMALGAYNGGVANATLGQTGVVCHWTSNGNTVILEDTRSTPHNLDAGGAWVVWDNNTSASTCAADGPNTTNVWIYDKVDSVVGDRCYFAQPQCNMNAAAADLAAIGNKISLPAPVWGPDAALPAAVSGLLLQGGGGSGTISLTNVSIAATDIRPEDAAWAMCRANSALGFGTFAGAAPPSDSLDGLGYGNGAPANTPGACPTFASPAANKVGNPIISAVSVAECTKNCPPPVAQANVAAFNITGNDPFSNTKIPAFTVLAVGAAPIVFITERDKGQLNNVKNATELQLQQVFSGLNCNGNAFDDGVAGAINVFLREATSGTMNTTEASVFRHPTVYPGNILGISQETGVNPANANNNPLQLACAGGGGTRYRGIGTGEVVTGVKDSGSVFGGHDGIAYTFFSYGNISSIANSATYGYLTLNGVDPIWQGYGTTYDPGENAIAGALPTAAFPAAEGTLWTNGFSFPNLRNGTYRAWSLLRLVGTNLSAPEKAAAKLVTASNKYVVTTVPDYVPAVTVTGTTDLGLKLVRSHYNQHDGAGVTVEKVGDATNVPENGGDMGGMIIPTAIGVTTEKIACMVQNETPSVAGGFEVGSLGPVQRPLNAGHCK